MMRQATANCERSCDSCSWLWTDPGQIPARPAADCSAAAAAGLVPVCKHDQQVSDNSNEGWSTITPSSSSPQHLPTRSISAQPVRATKHSQRVLLVPFPRPATASLQKDPLSTTMAALDGLPLSRLADSATRLQLLPFDLHSFVVPRFDTHTHIHTHKRTLLIFFCLAPTHLHTHTHNLSFFYSHTHTLA